MHILQKKLFLAALLTTLLFISNTVAANECCNRDYATAEYLYWKIKDSPEPVPLVYTGPSTLPRPILGDPDTKVVLA